MKTIKSIKNFVFEYVWNIKSDRLKDEISSFWLNHHVVPTNELKKRTEQVVVVIRNDTNKIIGVSSAFPTYFEGLKAHVYAYRCFIEKQSRAPGLEIKLVMETKQCLFEGLPELDKDVPVGLLAIVQNQQINKIWNKAVWSDVNLTYIGNMPSGDQIRISYFDNARI